MRLGPLVHCGLALVTAAVQLLHAQPVFVEVGAAAGIGLYQTNAEAMGGGVAAADFDDDGFVDLFVPNGPGVPDQLYRNLGDGSFEEIAASVGLASTDVSRTAVWLDYDGDGDLDLAVAGDCQTGACSPTESALRLFRQDSPTAFQEVTTQAGLFQSAGRLQPQGHRAGLASGDIDNDGDLDLFAGVWRNGPPALYRNNGNGTFTDIAPTAGVDVDRELHQMIFHDFDGDGWLDLFVAVDFEENHLWVNQRDGTFLDVAATAGVDGAWNEMGVALGDYDADGDFDVYVTNIDFDGRHNRLYRNETAGGVVSFSEVAMAAAVAYTGWGWGATFLDGDNDGTLDLAVTNGWTSGAYTTDQSKFFANQNDDPVTFADVSATVAFDDTYRASSLIAADLDRDGDLDLVQTVLPVALPTPKSPQLRLLQNLLIENGSTDAFLTVRPRMPGLNSHAIGAVVKVVVGASETIRLITAGTSYLGQEPAEAVFGLGDNQQADRLVIDWPDGTTSSWTNVTANQTLTLTAEPLPLLYASPKAIAYGNVPVGDDTASPLTLSNATAGSGSLQVTAITLSDPANFWIDPAGGSAPCGVTTPSIPAGASCTMSVHLTPLAAASLTTELTIDSDSAGGPEVVTLTGCSGAATVQLSNTVIDTTELHEACGTLTVGPDVQVTDTGRATLRARAVTLGDDVSVTGGGELTVVTVAPTD